jgi:diguanylate cyclase (GGDEF)-like protein
MIKEGNDTMSKKILIVDDIKNNIQLLGSILGKEGYAVSYATSGAKALAMNDKETFDLILLDVMMPEMDGFSVCRELKRRECSKDIPVLFLTAKSENDDIVAGLQQGAVDYLTKPFNSAELIARVKTHLALREAQQIIVLRNTQLQEKNEHLTKAIAEQIKLGKEIQILASTDSLTGINNRRSFFEKATNEGFRSKRYQTALSILMLDIDHFKKINDTYGHHIGDVSLKTFTTVCQDMLRNNDIFGRLGGEEFSIILVETGREEALLVAERLRLKVADTTICHGKFRFTFQVSIGLTQLLKEDATIEEAILRADKALYESKNQGRNRVTSL